MIKLECTIEPSTNTILYPPKLQRETTAVHKARAVCVELCVSGIKVWLKGTRDDYSVPYDKLFVDAQQGSVSLAARSGAVTQKTAAALINRDMETALRKIAAQSAPADSMAYAMIQLADAALAKLVEVPA